MKKLSNSFLVVFLLLQTGILFSQVKVAYMTLSKAVATGAATLDNDAIIQYLKSNPAFQVTVFITDVNGAVSGVPVNLNGFDVIIAQESYGSGDNVWKTGYPLALANLPAPILYNKLYALRAGRALPTGTPGASADANNVLIW